MLIPEGTLQALENDEISPVDNPERLSDPIENQAVIAQRSKIDEENAVRKGVGYPGRDLQRKAGLSHARGTSEGEQANVATAQQFLGPGDLCTAPKKPRRRTWQVLNALRRDHANVVRRVHAPSALVPYTRARRVLGRGTPADTRHLLYEPLPPGSRTRSMTYDGKC